MRKILITGGLGYIGAKLALALNANKDIKVRVLDNFSHQFAAPIATTLSSLGIEIVRKDIRSDKIKDDIEWSDKIFHLAAIVGFPACDENPEIAKDINVNALKKLQDYVVNRHLFYPNTNSGYGTRSDGEPCTEKSMMTPITLYGKTKVEAEEAIIKRTAYYTIFRLATVYGTAPRPRLDLLVNNFAYKAWKDKCNVIYEGHSMRNYIHINDLVRALCKAEENSDKDHIRNQVFNLGDDKLNCTKLELANRINEVLPHEIIEGNIGKDPDKRNYRVSNAKAIEAGILKCEETFIGSILNLRKQFEILDKPMCGNY